MAIHDNRDARAKLELMFEDPSDIDLNKPSSDDRLGPSPRQGPPLALLVAIGVLLVALGAAYIFLRRPPLEPSVPGAKISKTAPVQQAEPGEQIVLPPLDHTDPIVRQLVERLSSHPTVAAWLTTDGLIMNFVMVTARIANGETPVGELKALGPIPRFRTRGPTRTVQSIRRAIDGTTVTPRQSRRSMRAGRAVVRHAEAAYR